jgi:hypothetical protein
MGQRHLLEVHNKLTCTFHFLIGVNDIILVVVIRLLRASINLLVVLRLGNGS